MYCLPLAGKDGVRHSAATLTSLVGRVLEMADGALFETVDEPPISVLTSMERDSCAAQSDSAQQLCLFPRLL